MDIETLKEHIKKHEGFRNKVYLDHLGNRTIGYGHLCLPNEKWDDDKIYDSKELNKTFEYDFNIACNDAEKLIATLNNLDERIRSIEIKVGDDK